MAALFTSPRYIALSSSNVLLPGAKLYFYATGTSTPQNTYQDASLTTPHANPVVADAAGVFAKIYLDASLPNYRVTLTDSAGVTQPGYPIDDYPSNQNTGQAIRLISAAPEIIFEQSNATAGNKKWRIRVATEQLRVSLLNDAESVATDLAIIDRSGSTGDLINLLATQVQGNGLNLLGAQTVVKLVDTDRSSTTTLADDPELSVSVPVSGLYRIDVGLAFYGPVSGAQGFKYRLNPTNGSSGNKFTSRLLDVNGSRSVGPFASAFSGENHATISTSGNNISIRDVSRLTPSGAMTVALQWAQDSSSANVTRVANGSYLTITRIGD